MEPNQSDSHLSSNPERSIPNSGHQDYDTPVHAGPKRKGLTSFVRYLVLALVILTISFVASTLLPENPNHSDQNLIERAIDASDGLVPSFESSDPQLLTEFIGENFEWDSGPPFINETALRGVAIHEVLEGLELPSYVYEDAHGGQIAVYIISYRLLDESVSTLLIDENILKRVSEEYDLVSAPSKTGTQAVMWREYSFLFLAVSSSDAPVLMSRINPKRSP